MTVYLINIALILGLGFIFVHINPTINKKKVYCSICAVQWILISGLRHISVGADTENYYDWFEETKNLSWQAAINNCWDYLFNGLEVKDPGYNLLQKIFQIFFDDYQMWLLFIAVLFTGLMARWIYKYSTMPDISFLVYSVLFYSFFALTGHRQTIATALIFFLGYELVKKREFIKFAIVAFIAFMIHKSSSVFIIYYFIAHINFTPAYFLVIICTVIIFALYGSQIAVPIVSILGFDEEHLQSSEYDATTYAVVLLLLCIVAFCMYPWINKNRKDTKYLYNLLFLTAISAVLVYKNQGFMRVQQYYSLVIMVIIPEMIQAFDKNYRVIPYLFVVAFLLVYLIRNNPQYAFFFT